MSRRVSCDGRAWNAPGPFPEFVPAERSMLWALSPRYAPTTAPPVPMKTWRLDLDALADQAAGVPNPSPHPSAVALPVVYRAFTLKACGCCPDGRSVVCVSATDATLALRLAVGRIEMDTGLTYEPWRIGLEVVGSGGPAPVAPRFLAVQN